jgi:beta-phosphoglucomutase-like phosphatase (HAD superfamily)
MIRVVMFDLGRTLVDETRRPFPHVEDALAAIAEFKTEDGKPLQSCLVSDFEVSDRPVTEAEIPALFAQYLSILDQTGLRRFFESVNERVTLSIHARAMKPDRRIFEKALERLGVTLPLEDCLLVTEEASHIHDARTILKMKALQFRNAGSGQADFEDWAEAPALIADLVAPHQIANIQAAAKAHLAAQGVDLLQSEPGNAPGTLRFFGQMWSPIPVPGFKDLQNVQVEIPVEGEIRQGPKGEVRSIAPLRPSQEMVAEVASFVRGLAANGRIATDPAKRGPGTTHEITTDEKGNRRLVRYRLTKR